MMKTTDTYKKELLTLGSGVTVRAEYRGASTPIDHRCVCGTVWKIAPTSALRGTQCKECGNKKIASSRSTSPEQYEQKLKKIHGKKITVLGKYKHSGKPLKHECMTCNHIWNPLPDNLLQGSGCPKCMATASRKRNTKSETEYKRQLALISGGAIRLVSSYLGDAVKTKHKCRKCSAVWSAIPSNLLKGHGCGKCSYNTHKAVKLGKRTVLVRGFEPQALKLLLDKYKPEEIVVSSEGSVPVVRLSERKKHWPDFYVKKCNLLIEVKSIASLGFFETKMSRAYSKPSGLFYATVDKRNAARNAGFKYRLMLIHKGREITLPSNWHKMTFREFKRNVAIG